jgi:hypothetical protein
MQGLWLVLLGWLLNTAARASYCDLLLRESLSDVSVDNLMRTQFDRIEPQLSLEAFVREHAMVTDQQNFPSEEGDALLGMISIDQARRVPETHWHSTSVSEVMVPRQRLATLGPAVGGKRLLAELASRNVELPVMQGDHLLGLVRQSDLQKWLRLHEPQSSS